MMMISRASVCTARIRTVLYNKRQSFWFVVRSDNNGRSQIQNKLVAKAVSFIYDALGLYLHAQKII